MVSHIQKGLLAFVVTGVLTVSANGQQAEAPWNRYAPTPKALEMTRFGHMPPDLNSGIYSYDIPIYTYEDKDFSIPVSLHYSSSGFQPAKVSDEAGLHWTLMAGGAITRETVGMDDFRAEGFYHFGPGLVDSLFYKLTGTIPLEYTSSLAPMYGGKETTPDRYHFTFPGHSGSFIMDSAGQGFIVYGTEKGSGVYHVDYDGSTNIFTISTGDGYCYRFGHGETNSSEEAREVNWGRVAVTDNEQPSSHPESFHTVTWLLDCITAPNGRTIHFKYESARGSTKYDIPNQSLDVLTSFSRQTYKKQEGSSTSYHKKASLTFTSYLKQIVVDTPLSTGEQLTVNFCWKRDTVREILNTDNDIYTQLVVPRRHLDSIKVNAADRVLRQAELEYHQYGTRPFLTNVHIDGLGDYGMEYWTNESIPGILTNALDYWGYYNGRDTTSDDAVNPMSLDQQLNETIDKHYMDPDWQYARLGMLKRITYPTDGYTEIEYEPNQAQEILLRRYTMSSDSGLQPADPLNDPDIDVKHFLPALFPVSTMSSSFAQDCGGVRVKRLIDNDGETSSVHTFTYSDGIIQQFPRFNCGRIYGIPLYDPDLRFPGSSFDQRHVAYGTVRQENPDSSYVVTSFTSWEDCPDEYSFNRIHRTNESIDLNQILDDNIFREPDSRSYQRGLPAERKSYDNQDNLLAQESWEYDDIGSGYRAYALYSGQYVWTARTFLCDRKPSRYVRKEWFDNTAAERTEQTDYTYNGLGQLRQTLRTSGSHTEIQRTTYPGDIASGVYPAMAAANYLDMPVERVTIRDGKVAGATLTTYGLHSGQYLPEDSYRGSLGDNMPFSNFIPYNGQSVNSFYDRELAHLQYDNLGNPLLSENKEEVPTSYWWDSRKDKLSAVFVGSRNGLHSYYVRGAVPQTETNNYFNANPAEKAFTCGAAGSFSFSFTPVDTLTILSAQLDGNVVSLQHVGNGAQGTASPIQISAGSHTLRIVSIGESNLLRGGWHPIEEYPVTGTLSITYPKSGAVQEEGDIQDCLFEDFETSGGTVRDSFHSDKCRTTNYNQLVDLVVGREYVLDYMRYNNGEWQYVRSTIIPTTGPYSLYITASSANPVDHVRVYPAGTGVASFTWWPTGELRCRVDGDGLKETYEYDALGRLTVVKDNDGNVVKRYSYNYIH